MPGAVVDAHGGKTLVKRVDRSVFLANRRQLVEIRQRRHRRLAAAFGLPPAIDHAARLGTGNADPPAEELELPLALASALHGQRQLDRFVETFEGPDPE